MPALRAFGRRWNLGSDDFVLPGITEIIIRGAWVIILIVVFVVNREDAWCSETDKVLWFYLGTVSLLVIHIIIGIITTCISARGTIKFTKPRKHLAKTLYARVVFLIPELGWSVYGAWLTFRSANEGCQEILFKAGRGVVVIEWIILGTICLAIAFMFDPLGKRHMRKKSSKDIEQNWKRRCRILCCCLSGDENRQNAFEEIADLLTKFFKGKDIVFTDVIAGLVLLNVQQRYRPKVELLSQKKLPENDHAEVQLLSHKKLPDHDHTDDDNEHAEQLLKPPDASDNTELNHNNAGTEIPADEKAANNEEPDSPPITINVGSCRFRTNNNRPVSQSSDTSRRSSGSSETEFDHHDNNVQSSNIKRQTEPKEWMTLENAEYYSRYAVGIYAKYNYAMFKNCSQRIPLCRRYRCCCQPHTLSSKIMTGDNSCECQTAALLHYTKINPDDIIYANFDNQIYETPYFIALDSARKSIVIAIRGTKTFQDAVTDLTAFGESFEEEGIPAGNVHSGILKVARHIKGELDKINFAAQIPEGYNVIVTGHSLGAGAAVILSMLLRKDYPDIRCYAFSPPGGLVSLTLQIFTEEFVCSVVLGNDLVPRISLESMETFKENLLRVLKHCQVPKYKILAHGFRAMCCGWSNSAIEKLLVSTSKPMRPGSIGNQSKASITTNKMFDITNGSSKYSNNGRSTPPRTNLGERQLTDPTLVIERDPSIGMINSRPSAVSLAVDTDSDAVSMDSQYSAIRRHKDGDGEPKERPTTYHQFHKSHNKWKRDREIRLTGLRGADPLFLPGHVLHVVEEPSVRQLHRAKPTFTSSWANTQNFTEIVVCPNMLHHHHGYILSDVLRDMVKRKRFTSESGTLREPVVSSQPPATTSDHVVEVREDASTESNREAEC